MLQDLREIMGLTVEQVADELRLSPEQIKNWEQTDDKQYSRMFFHAFPLNKAVLKYPDADPFLPSYDQTSPGKRMEIWMLENGIPASVIAERLGGSVSDVLGFIQNPEEKLTREKGEEIERKTGINRKWLMYGDGRNRGKPIRCLRKNEQNPQQDQLSLIEKMAADFEKLPDEKIKTAEEELQERKALGQKVREARKEAGLSLKEAAEVLHVSASRVGQLECGIITARRAEEALRMYARYTGSLNIRYEGTAAEKAGPGIRAAAEAPLSWGEKIRLARKEAGLSQQNVGDMIHMSHATVSLMEKGRVSEETARWVLRLIEEAAGRQE